MYKLSQDLIVLLEQNKIRYCHWKSNLLLNEALAGYDDLDLLVNKNDQSKFEKAIKSLGFIEASNIHIHINDIKHFYGLDSNSGEILHLHVYNKILTGPSWIKSYHFNIEEYILTNIEKHESGMIVPYKYIELVFLVFRVLLKHTKLTELILVSKENERNKREFIYLSDELDKKKLTDILSEHFPAISEKHFLQFFAKAKGSSLLSKYLSARQLKKKIIKYNRYTSFIEFYKNMYQLFYRIFNKLFFHQKKKVVSGGRLVVIVGLDATGKTTITSELKNWLSKNFTVSLVHFGKPPSSVLTLPVNLLIKILRNNFSNINLKSSIKTVDRPQSLLYVIRQLTLAYDRHRLVKKYWRKVSKGEIVICDRYKSIDYGVMDSRRLNPSLYNGFKKKLAMIENGLYNKMPEPDLLLYLTVPVDVAVQRNEKRIKEGKESEEFLRSRYKINKNLKYDADRQFIIDTNQEYLDVLYKIKQVVWQTF